MPFADSHGIQREQLVRGLAPLFGDLPDDILLEIAASLEPVKLPAGAVLVSAGDPGDGIHIVLNGRLSGSLSDGPGREREVTEVAAGESVGETSLLTRRPHSVTYRAVRDTVLVRLSQASFVELSHTHPGLLWSVTRLVTRRLEQAHRGATRSAAVRTIAVMFLDTRIDREDFMTRLGAALRLHGPEIRVDASAAPGHGLPQAEALWTSGWLDGLEAAHRFVVMQLDDEPTPWSRRCVRQADRILLVAAADGDPRPGPLETALLGDLPAGPNSVTELVLVHDPQTVTPSGTAAWLTDRRLLRHHHLRRDRDRDFARLGRFLAGEAIGLVLAGGGAKAFVHLGVIRALHEAGIPVDLVGGTSMGAILAAAVARDWDPAEIAAHCRQAFGRRNPLTDYAFPPLISMMRGKRIEKLLRTFFGEGGIEDLWLPYLCVSGDFTAGEMAVHRRGGLWQAIKASISLPGILPPMVIDGHLHVDGGTFDNFPVEPVRAAGAGRIVASDIWIPRRPDLGYAETPSGGRFFLERYVLRRRALKVPHVMTTMFRSSFLASHERRRAAKQGADLYFSSPSGRVGLTHWKKLDDAMAAGYSHALRRLAEADPGTLQALGASAPPAEERRDRAAAGG